VRLKGLGKLKMQTTVILVRAQTFYSSYNNCAIREKDASGQIVETKITPI
jgi:hypothetical protein